MCFVQCPKVDNINCVRSSSHFGTIEIPSCIDTEMYSQLNAIEYNGNSLLFLFFFCLLSLSLILSVFPFARSLCLRLFFTLSIYHIHSAPRRHSKSKRINGNRTVSLNELSRHMAIFEFQRTCEVGKRKRQYPEKAIKHFPNRVKHKSHQLAEAIIIVINEFAFFWLT